MKIGIPKEIKNNENRVGMTPAGVSELTGQACVPENIGVVALQHLGYMIEYYGEKNAIPMFRKHAAWYSAGLPNSADFRIRVNGITSVPELVDEICKFWGCERTI